MKNLSQVFARALFASALSIGMAAAIQPENAPKPTEVDRGAAGLNRCLAELKTRASILMITAHPDDEDGGLLAYETRGVGARGELMTLTRGEGGQNAMSNDMYDALGILRTEELLAADRYYGVDQYWSSVIDYGFSKTREEAWQKWGHDRVLGEVVRVIRMTRPLILVSVFAGAPTDGHGNHQVAGEVTQEAFLAAGDPKQFPEQIREGLRPWTPLKVYAHVPFFQPTKEGIYDYATDKYVPVRFFDYVHQMWIEGKPSTAVALQEGQRDASAGLTFQQIGREGLAYQKSQNHGGSYSPPGFFLSQYHRYGSRVDVPDQETSMFEGIDTSLAGIAGLAQGDTASLRSELSEIDHLVTEAANRYRADDPEQIAPDLAAALGRVRTLRESVEHGSLSEPGRSDAAFELQVKEHQLEHALELAFGLYFDATVAAERSGPDSPFAGPATTFTVAVPEQRFAVQTHLVNTGKQDLQVSGVSVTSPRGEDWHATAGSPTASTLASQKDVRVRFEVQAPADAAITRPYFTRPDEEQPYYNVRKRQWQAMSFAPYPLEATATITYNGQPITLHRVVQAVHHEEVVGLESDPLIIEPAISVSVQPGAGAVPLDAKSFAFTCTLHSNAKGPANGTLHLRLPQDWTSNPAEYPFGLQHDGDSRTVTFEVLPRNTQSKAYEIQAVADFNGKSYSEGYRMVGYAGLRSYPYYRPASYQATGVDVHVAPGLRVAFVAGTGDDVPQALNDLGVSTTVVPASELQTAALGQYDAIVLGVRAYAVRPELRTANDRLLDYVKNGGILLVQYQWQNFDRNYGPYPFVLGSSPAKVVDETAAVQLLNPSNPLLNWPNKVTERDFDHWQEERGHGFMQSWDSHYHALTETHDPDQPEQKGGLLVAQYGKGFYIYDAFALYRQLPAGVPGAFRILANLVSAGKNPQMEVKQ